MNALKELTKQERIILGLVAQGKRNAQIAQALFLSIRTVEGHLYNIFQKLELSSRTEAAIYAFHTGLLPKPESGGTTGDKKEGSSYYEVRR